MIRSDKFVESLIQEKNIRKITIYFRDESTSGQHDEQAKPELNRIIEYIINNISTSKLEIVINPTINIELNLSQMQPCAELIIFDPEGTLPKEYLYHLVKLLENRRTKIVRFLYNKDIPLKEDLAEFDNIRMQIDYLITYARMTTYIIQLKD